MSRAEQIDIGEVPQGLGAVRPVELPATRYRQGGRVMYHVVATLAGLPRLIVKRPDPNRPLEGNRKVDAGRAKKFAGYVITNGDWVSPAIIVRAPSGEIEFDPLHEFDDGTAWGVLRIPLPVLTEILLLDGQHRTLGTFLALDDVNGRVTKHKDLVAKAEHNGDTQVAQEHKRELKKDLAIRDRLSREHISIDVAVVTTEQAKQMFADINNNAKGVNPDYTTYLDQRDVVNRIAVKLMDEHQLLVGRVEVGQSVRMSPSNPHLMGAKAVADLVRAVHVGATGRIGRRIDDQMAKNEEGAYQRVRSFLDVLVAAFPDLRAVMNGEVEAADMRKTSLLGSATMLRALAGAYHDLTKRQDEPDAPNAFSRSEVEDFFRRIEGQMSDIPVTEDGIWHRSRAFVPGGSAPQGMQGAVRQLVDFLVGWARNGEPPLAETQSAA